MIQIHVQSCMYIVHVCVCVCVYPMVGCATLILVLHLQGFPGNAVVPITEFVNIKLSSKASRQLQGEFMLVSLFIVALNFISDPLNVMTGSFPNWLKELAKQW